MKILHTSDWHLGHILYGRDRLAEQQCMLSRLGEIIAAERPDALVVSGDIYHTGQPSATVQRLFADALSDFSAAVPDMHTVVIAGNHDSASRLGIFERPWKRANVSIVSFIDAGEPDDMIVELPGRGFVIAVPYTNSRNLPDGLYASLCGRVVRRNTDGLPVVMAAHTTVQGCNFTGHDHVSDKNVGGIDAVSIADFGSGFDYLALGHIHRAQTVGAEGRIRYCGTPLPVSFDETGAHTVSVVEIAARGAHPSLREIEIANPLPLITLPEEGFAPWDEIIELLRSFPDNRDAYIRLNILTEGFLPVDAREQVEAITASKRCEVLSYNSRMKETPGAPSACEFTPEELERIDPMEIARGLLPEGGFDSDLEEMFNEVCRLVDEEKRDL